MREVVHASHDIIKKSKRAKVQKQAQWTTGNAKIGVHLPRMNCRELCHRFQFSHHAAFDDVVRHVRVGYDDALITERERHLAAEFQFALRELVGEARRISGLEATRPEFAMDSEPASSNFVRNPIELRFRTHGNPQCMNIATRNPAPC